jgi:C4-dicarboxylate transporter DctQ subunit
MLMLGVHAEDIPLPRWLLSIILPIGFGLLALRLLQVLWHVLTGSNQASLLGDEAAEVLRAHALETEEPHSKGDRL